MLAARLPGLLPPLEPAEALEVSMIHSIGGHLAEGKLLRRRPFRDPHHSASVPSLVGGGSRAKPGEVSLAHNGVLFLDELPEFQRAALEALRQPLESGRVSVARANAHVVYPSRIQLVAAMNPCRCGYLGDAGLACTKAPKCGAEYQNKISGPLFDRIDLHVEVPAVSPADLSLPPPAEGSAQVAARVAAARALQAERGRNWASAAMPCSMARSWKSWPPPTPPAVPCWPRRPTACVCRHAAITGCYGWPAPWPICKAAAVSAACTWPKPCHTAG